MASSNGNIFRVIGPLCGEFTGPGEFPTQRPVTRSFDVFFDIRLNKRLSKQPWGWWFETPSWPLWRHGNGPCVSCDLWLQCIYWRYVRTDKCAHMGTVVLLHICGSGDIPLQFVTDEDKVDVSEINGIFFAFYDANDKYICLDGGAYTVWYLRWSILVIHPLSHYFSISHGDPLTRMD